MILSLFLDSDDQWLPFHLSSSLHYLQRHPFRIVQSQEIWIRHGRRVNIPKTHIKKEGDLFQDSVQKCFISPSAVLIERSLLDQYGPFDTSLPVCEDFALWLPITAFHPVGLLPKNTIIKYGGSHPQLSHSVLAIDRFRVYALVSFYLKYHSQLSASYIEALLQSLFEKMTFLKQRHHKDSPSPYFQSSCQHIHELLPHIPHSYHSLFTPFL